MVHKRLLCVNLSKNQLGDAGAAHLGEMLEANTSITALYVQWNRIKEKGGADLCFGTKFRFYTARTRKQQDLADP